MRCSQQCTLIAPLFLIAALPLFAQQPASFPTPLDLGRDIKPLAHTPLPEEYLWTAGGATSHHGNSPDAHTEPHFFRRTFRVSSVPESATLYVAGPRSADVFLNGKHVGSFASDPDGPINFRVFHLDISHALQRGDNVLALKVVRGHGTVAADPSPALNQLAYGEVLAVKILAAPYGHDGPALALSDKQWQSLPTGAVDDHFADAHDLNTAWKPVDSLGSVESNRDFMQWSADAGMYGWPGYTGVTAPLGTYTVTPAAITHVFQGTSRLEHIDSLTSADAHAPEFTVIRAPDLHTDLDSPAILVDFGRELAGRVLVENVAGQDATLSIAYGESELEALGTGLTSEQRGGNYLGTNLLDVPANGSARGPKSAFRFVRIRFLHGGPEMRLWIRAEAIAYPVTFSGSFESSDPLLNRIWETGAYTAHLCMQDDLWDAPKRDRGRWAGDMDVEGRVISTAFGDKALIERTLAALASTDSRPVNGIPGYSALWITTLASLYEHSGDLEYLRSQHNALLHVLATMDATLDSTGLFAPQKNEWPFVDWAPDLFGATPATTLGTSLQYLRAYRAAATLLDRIGDSENRARAQQAADRLQTALAADMPPSGADRLGHTPQLNALAIQSGAAADSSATEAIWSHVLSHVKQDAPEDPVISPYFNATVIDAMSMLGHQREALDWVRTYWGGMLAEGATSFWESYDLRWPKNMPHLSLQADGTSGFFVSMAHGWSSGPTAWLSENVLGVRDPQDGYRTFTFAPHLLNLDYAKGSVPTPHGLVHVSLRKEGGGIRAELDLPPGIDAVNVTLSPLDPKAAATLDGRVMNQASFPLHGAGKHTIAFTPAP